MHVQVRAVFLINTSFRMIQTSDTKQECFELAVRIEKVLRFRKSYQTRVFIYKSYTRYETGVTRLFNEITISIHVINIPHYNNNNNRNNI